MSRSRGAAGRLLGLLVLDGLLPLLTYLGLSRLWHARAWEGLGRVTALSWNLSPSDENGTVWFWWWMGRARLRGQSLLFSDVTCLPTGERLQFNHPNRVDAWLAQPLLDHLGLPAGYDLFLLLVPVASSFGAWVFLRSLGVGRLVPLAAAAVFGFGGYSVLEATEGRPVSSLLAFVPLSLAPWAMAHRAPRAAGRLAWAAVAGLALALQAWAYIPYAFFLALAFAASAAAAAARPRPSAPRWMPVLQVVVAGLVALLATAPYLHELVVVRPGGFQGMPIPVEAQHLRWDPGVLGELWAVATGAVEPIGAPEGTRPPPPPEFLAPYWVGVQGESMPWDYLWRGAGARAHRAVEVPGAFVLGAVLVAATRRRAWPAALVTVFTWLLTLGPNAAVRTERAAAELLLVAGHRVALPTSALLGLAPQLDVYLRPYRLVPFVVLAAAACVALGAEDWRRRLSGPGDRGRGRWARVPLVLGCALCLQGLWQGAGLPGSTWRLSHMGRPAALQALAQEDGDGVIAELPAGVGHGAGGLQALHGLGRVDPLHDVASTAGEGGPPTCFRGAFAQAVWALGRADARSARSVEEGLADGALAAARRAGVRWIVMYPALYGQRPDLDRASAERELRARLGPPVHQDPALKIWALP
ncbi:hypothetical protein L6R53_03225 [Myxococcota bacterium]|nr:hypothetical protein [Myxococcota bacterium]